MDLKKLALEFAPHSIRVNSIHPANVNTDMIQNEPMYRLFVPDLRGWAATGMSRAVAPRTTDIGRDVVADQVALQRRREQSLLVRERDIGAAPVDPIASVRSLIDVPSKPCPQNSRIATSRTSSSSNLVACLHPPSLN